MHTFLVCIVSFPYKCITSITSVCHLKVKSYKYQIKLWLLLLVLHFKRCWFVIHIQNREIGTIWTCYPFKTGSEQNRNRVRHVAEFAKKKKIQVQQENQLHLWMQTEVEISTGQDLSMCFCACAVFPMELLSSQVHFNVLLTQTVQCSSMLAYVPVDWQNFQTYQG